MRSLFLFVFLSTQAFPSVVKISSFGDCGSQSPERRGSGILVSLPKALRDSLGAKSEAFVLSSSHVAFHSGSKVCHHAVYENKTAPLEIRAVDFTKDLILFEVMKGDLPTSRIEIFGADRKFPKPRTEVSVVGFPFSLSTPLPYPGQIQFSPSPRSFSPEVKVLEASGITEFGMSGGGVFEEVGNRWLGILSHQARVLPAGGEATLIQRAPGGALLPMLNLIIPVAEIQDWLTGIQKAEKRFFREALTTQVRRRNGFVFGDILFTEPHDCGFTKNKKQVGGDPSGVGGEGERSHCSMEVSYVADNELGSFPLNTEQAARLANLPRRGGIINTVRGGLWERSFSNYLEFASLLRRGGTPTVETLPLSHEGVYHSPPAITATNIPFRWVWSWDKEGKKECGIEDSRGVFVKRSYSSCLFNVDILKNPLIKQEVQRLGVLYNDTCYDWERGNPKLVYLREWFTPLRFSLQQRQTAAQDKLFFVRWKGSLHPGDENLCAAFNSLEGKVAFASYEKAPNCYYRIRPEFAFDEEYVGPGSRISLNIETLLKEAVNQRAMTKEEEAAERNRLTGSSEK